MDINSAWIFIGGLSDCLTEGDIITVFSQYGEVVNINLPRDRRTGKPCGFCFLCYQDKTSTRLAVDNLSCINLLGRTLTVKYVEEYKVPKYRENVDEETKRLWEEGCGPKPIQRVKEEKHKAKMLQEGGCRIQNGDLVRRREEFIYNPRPPLEKANWRDIEVWRETRKREKDLKRRSASTDDEFFVPKRYR
ncbi:hypothetical protein NECAME_01252 [Necator americanus]|uniref:RRM domain-containing protein n=1 Tax=Necator americanus TaxID=51031 RepID=W2TZJ3_NECAM|nr:hypothetical protein NECAME_01252 [Necator americanus]ETN87094.1 hypothetical protein NECAME_01252 [Necator americanus]